MADLFCLSRASPRGDIDLVGKDAHRNRDGDIFGIEKGQLVFPIKPCRRNRRARQPVERDIVEDVVSREALALSVEDARDELVTANVVVKYPRCEADG